MNHTEDEQLAPERFMEVATGKSQWTQAELRMRAADPAILLKEAMAHVTIDAAAPNQTLRGESHLTHAYQLASQMPTPELRVAAMDVIFDHLPRSRRSEFAAMCPERLQISDESIQRRLIAADLREALSGYLPGSVFWNSVFAGKELSATLGQVFADVYPGVPVEIADRIDMAILSIIQEQARGHPDGDPLQQLQSDMEQLAHSGQETGDNPYTVLARQLQSIRRDLASEENVREVQSLVQELRRSEFPHLPRASLNSPLGRG